MSSLGLHIGEQITAVWLGDDGAESVRTLNDAEAAAGLADWLQSAGSRVGAAFSAEIRARSLSFPFAQPAKIRQVLPLQLEEIVPGAGEDFEQLIHVGRAGDGGLAIVHLLPIAQAAAARQKLSALTANVRFLEPEALLMAQAQALTPGAALLWLGEKTTTIVSVNALGELGAVSIPIGAARLDDSAGASNLSSRLRATIKTPPVSLRLDGETGALPTLLHIAQRLWPTSEISTPETDDRPLAVRVASAAALRVAAHHRAVWNFAPRRPLFSPELVKSGLLRSLGAPLAVFCLLLIVATVSGTRAIRAEAAAQRAELSEIFKRNFPRSRDGGDPLRMMTNIVDRAGKKRPEGSAGKVIEGMAAFHDSITNASGINVAELRTADGNWTVRGEAPDFGGVERIKSALEGIENFSDIRVQRAEQTMDKSAIRFSLTWEEKR